MGYNAFWIRYLNATLPDTPVPTTFVVTVVDAGGNKYAINGVTQDTIQFTPGLSYVFDQSDSSNAVTRLPSTRTLARPCRIQLVSAVLVSLERKAQALLSMSRRASL